jgi:type III restriction enzyme
MPKVEKLNLSHHTLDINTRKCNYEKFDFSEVEDFVRELAGGRDYQFEAIKEVLIYLWGGGYSDIKQLAKENYKKKESIQYRFQTEENFLRRLPLPDRLSGVVHMATGTGKSYVIFAIAYLSLVMGKVNRVLVLGPSSTVIESGLNAKFKEHLFGKRAQQLQEKLPFKYRNMPINLLDENNPIEDNSIVIENINSIYNKDNNAIGDTLFAKTDEVLVLSDEVHHAYSHLTYAEDHLVLDEGGKGDDKNERLWMKFLREESKIKKHIGFTGTPYNQDEYFVDVIFNYSIKDAIDEKVIKKINPIIHTEAEGEEADLTLYQRFEQILITHDQNKVKYSYPDNNGKPLLKPITVFINATQASAQASTEEFIDVLGDFLKNTQPEYKTLTKLQIQPIAREKVICVISKPTDADYQEKLDAIEEIDPGKVGGKVEFIFAVNKLSEGWDVDNVYQIVPMQERIFASKLLISQVLGRGLRLPRMVPIGQIHGNYPIVTITNHERFADHIKDLVDAVTECESRFTSKVLQAANGQDRAKYNFTVFNLEYLPGQKLEDAKETTQDMSNRTLILTAPTETLKLEVTYLLDKKNFALSKNFYTVDQVVMEIVDRFAMKHFESKQFDFGDGVVVENLPEHEDIEKVVRNAMQKANFKEDKLSEGNRKQVDLFFNQFLPKGKKKVVHVKIDGNLQGIKTETMAASSARTGELDKYVTVFVSEDYENELTGDNIFILEDIVKRFKKETAGQSVFEFEYTKSEYFRQLTVAKPVFVVNTSMFKTPQNLVIVSHAPESKFVFQLIDNAKYITSWVKSRDMDFYSLDYEFFKGGKDRTRRSFNPDFFIVQDIERYIERVHSEDPAADLSQLHDLQDKGKKTIVRVVEIKCDEDQDEVTRAKERYGKEHFERLNGVLSTANPIDVPKEFRSDMSQHYTFDLLTPEHYGGWFNKLKSGKI